MEPYIHLLFRPEVKEPILVCGQTGLGNIGKIVTHQLIEFTQAKLFAELYSPSFPDYVLINEEGVCWPPRYEFYVSTTGGKDLIILTGDVQPSIEDVFAYYEICGKILDFVTDYGCKFIITLGGALGPEAESEIYIAATSEKIVQKFLKENVTTYGGDKIVGVSGLLLGLAKERGIDGVCLLGSTPGLAEDRESAFKVYRFLIRILGTDIKEAL